MACLLLTKCSKAYELIQKLKCLYLPSQRTLREYIHHTKPTIGFSNDLDEQLITNLKVNWLEDHQKYISIIGDEMHIKEGLVFSKSNGELVGYVDVGDINNHLMWLEKEYTDKNGEVVQNTLAKTMMVLMIRGLFLNFTFPYASFASSNLTGEQLIPIFYEAIMRVEKCGLKVLSITLDGNSVNRKFIKLVSNKDSPIEHKFKNPLSKTVVRYSSFLIPVIWLKPLETVWPILQDTRRYTKNEYRYIKIY